MVESRAQAAKKRKRDIEDGSQTKEPEIMRSPSFWHAKDGSVVLQAQSTQFLVHEGLRSEHSKLFRDMFSLPQPREGIESAEGRPIVRLSESAEDVGYFLAALYRPVQTLWTLDLDETSFALICALLRLSHKFVVPSLRSAAVDILRMTFPSSLKVWDANWPEISRDKVLLLLNLFEEVGVQTFLPTAFFLGAHGAYDVEAILRSPLSLSTRKLLFIGHEKLLTVFHELVAQSFANLPSTSCRKASSCLRAIRIATSTGLRSAFDPDCELGLLPDWDALVDNASWAKAFMTSADVCKQCHEACKKAWDAQRKEIWKTLPDIFGLDSWEKLAEKDASWYTDLAGDFPELVPVTLQITAAS